MLTTGLTLADVLRSLAPTRPRLWAVADGDVRCTWRELDAHTNRVANALHGVALGRARSAGGHGPRRRVRGVRRRGARRRPRRGGGAGDAVLLIHTAAFDGRPNAAMLSSRAIRAQALLMAPMMGITDAHVYLNAGPMLHIGVCMENVATFLMGGTTRSM